MRSVIDAANRNYKNYENVCSVSHGSKFTNGEADPAVKAIQFFVTEKMDKESVRKPLPAYVYDRDGSGKVDRTRRIATDVIELRNLELCCLAGDEITRAGGSRGVVTLIFENQLDTTMTLFLTCAHVASDMLTSPSVDEMVGGNVNCVFQGDILANSVIENGEVVYDIAVGVLSNVLLGNVGLLECSSGVVFSGFARADDLFEETTLECTSAISGNQAIQIRSESTGFENVTTPEGDQVLIHNLIACKGTVDHGDSGGIVYRDDRAVGIVVAKADDDWIFIHILEDAINDLMNQSGGFFQCF